MSRRPQSMVDDPRTHGSVPVAGEPESQRQARLEAEMEAKRISDLIDEELQREERMLRKSPKPVKMLLLGQSESGKTTTLKNFQLMNSPKAFRAERASWRAVIQLNVVRSIRLILDAMSDAQTASQRAASMNSPFRRPTTARSPSPDIILPTLDSEHLKLKMRLSPLIHVEETLIQKLTPSGSTEFEATHLAPVMNIPFAERMRGRGGEVAVNSQFQWKNLFGRLMSNARDSMDTNEGVDWEDSQDPGRIIHACGEDMMHLWNDPTIKALLEAKRMRLEDMPGFFLDSLDRITSPRYVPTDDDILRARLKTLGVTEYRFTIKEGWSSAGTRDWRVFDVGGQRSLRAAWVPFFDDMDVILFLAPISCFDQMLAEDPTVPRIQDSVLLWRSIVTNSLLAGASLVLFLNKVDIMKAKLASGIIFGHHVSSYPPNRPNDFENTADYLKRKFLKVFTDHSSQKRPFYVHYTSVTDQSSTRTILVDLQDTIVRQNLKDMNLVS